MRAKFINEKFKEKSDPIKDMRIGIRSKNFPKGFEPIFILKKRYPGMDWPVGTVFGQVDGWDSLKVYDNKGSEHGNTAWTMTYFIPWIGTFFEKF